MTDAVETQHDGTTEPGIDPIPWAVPAPDAAAFTATIARQATLTKPAGALGRLEPLSAWIAAVQGTCPPRPFTRPLLVILAGDHGVARAAGTSAYPPEVTAQMVVNFVTGGAGANVLARQVGATVRVVDVSVDADPGYLDAFDPQVASRRVRRSCGSVDREPAMTVAEAVASIRLGADLADEARADGADLLVPGDMGIGNTTAAAALTGLLTGRAADDVTGRGTGIDDATLARKRAAVAQAMDRGRPAVDDPVALLAEVGSPDIAAMSGMLARAAAIGLPVVLDGVISCAAALVSRRIAPGADAWWVAGHRSTEPAATEALAALGLDPLLDLGLRLGEGSGALLAVPVLQAASATCREMSTFADAGVSDRDQAD
jgi:nicotinate-nucleotide--dimethylbenzimidazole phosphoribosyltransferase